MLYEDFEETARLLAVINPYAADLQQTRGIMSSIACTLRDENATTGGTLGFTLTRYTRCDGKETVRATVSPWTVAKFIEERCTVRPRAMVQADFA